MNKYNNFSFITITQGLLLIAFFGLLNSSTIQAQQKDLVQFSGIIMTSDSLRPVFYATIWDKNTRKGTISNTQGFFSFVVHIGDTIEFSAIGYQDRALVIPKKLTSPASHSHSIIFLMENDTINLPTAIVYPWPTKEKFKQAFLELDVPDDDLQRARRNLEREQLREMAEAMAMDGRENFNYQMRQQAVRLYSKGQYAYVGLFDPFAWAEFFKALKRGDFKRKDKKKK